MDLKRRLSIVQIATDRQDSPKTLIYQLETLSSLLCFSSIHSLPDSVRVDLYTNRVEFWRRKAKPFLEFAAPRLLLKIHDASSVSKQMASQPFLIKCKLIDEAFISLYEAGQETAIYMDGDITSVRPWLSDLLVLHESVEFDLAMAHECGLTSLLPYPNYNSGFVFARLNPEVINFTSRWVTISKLMTERRSMVLDQDSMVFAIAEQRPNVLTLPSVYNLRCHEVYGYGADVWSPVFNIHSHITSRLFVRVLKMWLTAHLPANDAYKMILACLSALNSHFNVAEFPHKPRRVTASPREMLVLFTNDIMPQFLQARHL